MKVKMRTTIAGPNGTVLAGHISPEWSLEVCKALVEAGYADYVKQKHIETGMAEPIKETATIRKGKPQGRRGRNVIKGNS